MVIGSSTSVPIGFPDVQTEVLVFDVVELQYIAGAILDKGGVRDGYLQHLGDKNVNNKGISTSRGDFLKYQ
ncbi:MAG: hypothetical protein MESAZ_00047 [Saezia sanguinis]